MASFACQHMREPQACQRCFQGQCTAIGYEPTMSEVGDHDNGYHEDEDEDKTADTVDWKVVTSAHDAAEIARTWPTGTRKTRRYFHGMLSYEDHIQFLTSWRMESSENGHSQTKKGKKRGEISQIRGAMRMKYAAWFVSLNTIRAALKTKPEWNEWMKELLGERKEKLVVEKQKKKERKGQAEEAEAKAKAKAKRKDKLARRLAAKGAVSNGTRHKVLVG